MRGRVATKSENRCGKCHAKQVWVGPDGYSDCVACGTTNRPAPQRSDKGLCGTGPLRICRACGGPFKWARTRGKNYSARNVDGSAHNESCIDPGFFERERVAAVAAKKCQLVLL